MAFNCIYLHGWENWQVAVDDEQFGIEIDKLLAHEADDTENVNRQCHRLSTIAINNNISVNTDVHQF